MENNGFLISYLPSFDPKVLTFAEQAKQPVAVGELLTVASVHSSGNFAGPDFVIDGPNDLPFCGEDCTATGGTAASIPTAAKDGFPLTPVFSDHIQPETGHGLHLHYVATGDISRLRTSCGGKALG